MPKGPGDSSFEKISNPHIQTSLISDTIKDVYPIEELIGN